MDDAKRAAGEAAAQLVEPGMRLGFGTGSTVAYFLDALAARDLPGIVGIPTSEQTRRRCQELGLGLASADDLDALELAVDGADEFDDELQATKGGGGALLREKVVAHMAARFVVIATPDKQVRRLGQTFPLPVEVVPFALAPVRRALERRGAEVAIRGGQTDPTVTDNGNLILDATFPDGIEDPAVLDLALAHEPGVVTSGLFIDLVDHVILGHPDGSTTRADATG